MLLWFYVGPGAAPRSGGAQFGLFLLHNRPPLSSRGDVSPRGICFLSTQTPVIGVMREAGTCPSLRRTYSTLPTGVFTPILFPLNSPVT
jgi:hypothetical protein